MLPLQQLRKYLHPQCHLDEKQLMKLREELYALAEIIVDGLRADACASRPLASDQAEGELDSGRDMAISSGP
jgi:hypothetical protein